MLKALLKKQFLEIGKNFFTNPKTGERYSTPGIVAFALLFVLILASVAALCMLIAETFGSVLLLFGFDWLYFALGGVVALLLSTILSLVFCYTSTFRAHDNYLLLALPIPPRAIVSVRLVSVFAVSLVCCAVTWIPFMVWYAGAAAGASGAVSAGTVVMQGLLIVAIALSAATLSCLIGWLIASIANRVKRKSLAATISVFILFTAYLVCYFSFISMMDQIAQTVADYGVTLQGVALPLLWFGQAATGDVLSFALVLIVALLLFAVVFFVMDKTFVKVATTPQAAHKGEVYQEKQVKAQGIDAALLNREMKRFTSTPAYITNFGIGLLIMVALAVVALVKMEDLQAALVLIAEEAPLIVEGLPVFAPLVVCFMLSMCCVTAPSISIEGKELWIIRSLPVSAKQVLTAKVNMQKRICAIPALLCVGGLCFALGIDWIYLVVAVAIVLLYNELLAYAGVAVNLRFPNFVWSDPTVPIKRSMSVFILFFGGWVLCIAAGVAFGLLQQQGVDAETFTVGIVVVLVVALMLVRKWIDQRGAQIFDTLL